jgi:hypothetical protein
LSKRSPAGDDAKIVEEARATLARLRRERPGLLGSALARAGDHFAGRDEDAGKGDASRDAVEVWGRRVGRALGALFLVVLLINLFTRWFF